MNVSHNEMASLMLHLGFRVTAKSLEEERINDWELGLSDGTKISVMYNRNRAAWEMQVRNNLNWYAVYLGNMSRQDIVDMLTEVIMLGMDYYKKVGAS